jgi:hypothetical protein
MLAPFTSALSPVPWFIHDSGGYAYCVFLTPDGWETLRVETHAGRLSRIVVGAPLRLPGLAAGGCPASLSVTPDELPVALSWVAGLLLAGDPVPPYAWTPAAWGLNPRKGPDPRLPASWRLEVPHARR